MLEEGRRFRAEDFPRSNWNLPRLGLILSEILSCKAPDGLNRRLVISTRSPQEHLAKPRRRSDQLRMTLFKPSKKLRYSDVEPRAVSSASR